MGEQWITAKQALELAPDKYVLCARLHAGLIVASARLLIKNDVSQQDTLIPKKFWWAEGQLALDANWEVGDFATFIDRADHYKAFGVQMALNGVLDMLPPERRAIAIRRFSVAGNPEWISAQEARRLALPGRAYLPNEAGAALVELARLELVSARAVLAEGMHPTALHPHWREREWDVPSWFWEEFAGAKDTLKSWDQGKFAARCQSPRGREHITVSGVHFLKSSLVPDAPPAVVVETAPPSARGRPSKYDWLAATNAIWGLINRGELIPHHQVDVEKALQSYLTRGNDEPSESTVRPYASPIWQEFRKA